MIISQDILRKINEFLPPNVGTYVRLAAVNREFYSMFTSDYVWKNLNLYGVDKDIWGSFKRAIEKPMDLRLLNFYYATDERLEEPFPARQLMELTKNQFVYLGYVLKHLRSVGQFEEYPEIARCATRFILEHGLPLPRVAYEDDEWMIETIAKYPSRLGDFSGRKQYSKDSKIPERLFRAALHATVDNEPHYPLLYSIPSDQRDSLPESLIDEAVRQDIRNMIERKDLKEKYFANRDLVLRYIDRKPEDFGGWDLPDDVQNDKECLITALMSNNIKDAEPVRRASDELRKEFEIMDLAISKTPKAIEYSLNDNPKLFQRAIETLLKRTDGSRENAREFVKAIKNYLGEEELKNRDLVLQLAEHTTSLIEYLDESLMCDPDFYFEYLRRCSDEDRRSFVDRYDQETYGYLSKDTVLRILDEYKDISMYRHFSERNRKDEDIAIKALEIGTLDSQIRNSIPTFYDNRDHFLAFANRPSVHSMIDIPENLRDDKEVVIAAVKRHPCSLRFASERLKDDKDVVRVAFDAKSQVDSGAQLMCFPFRFVSQSLLDDPELLNELIEKCGTCPTRFLKNRKYALIALKNRPYNYRHLPEDFKNDFEFNKEAASLNAANMRFMKKEFFENSEILEVANLTPKTFCMVHCADSME